MMQVFQIKEDKRQLVPAVTHVDGSGRLQTVFQSTNPLYYRLIKNFRELTGVPMVLNTSFNVRGEPIVCTPADALACFMGTDMDALAIGDCLPLKAAQLNIFWRKCTMRSVMIGAEFASFLIA